MKTDNNNTQLKLTSPLSQQHQASWRDYLEMCKPNVVALMILTSVIGMMLARPGLPGWDIMLFGNLGIALMAASAAVINHVVDRKVDTLMARTSNRPLAKGKVEVSSALLFFSSTRWHRDDHTPRPDQCAHRVADAGVLDWLCVHLHPVPETGDTAKYRDWWIGWRSPSIIGLDGDDRSR